MFLRTLGNRLATRGAAFALLLYDTNKQDSPIKARVMGQLLLPQSGIRQNRRNGDPVVFASPPAPARGSLREQPIRHSATARQRALTDRQQGGDTQGTYERYCGTPYEILLQGFHWESCKTRWRAQGPRSWYEILVENAPRIRRAGITYVWFPPPCRATKEDGEGYEPTRWHCFDSSYGTESQLKAAIHALQGPEGDGARALADVVINHRCGTNDFADFSDPHFAGPGEHSPEGIARANCAAIATDDEWRRQHDCSLVDTPEESCYEKTTAGRHLDHHNRFVRAETKKWLKDWLRDHLGFAGFRYDMATGFPAKYVGQYNDHAQPTMSVGEFWREDSQELAKWVRETCGGLHVVDGDPSRQGGKSAALDFALRARLWDAFSRGDFTALSTAGNKPPGLIGLWPNMAVTFIENHDTEPIRGNGIAFPQDRILAGYAYILTHPGKPTVFWSHLFDYGEDQFQQSYQAVISQMIDIRRRNGIHSNSACRIMVAEKSLYAAVIDDCVAVKLGSSPSWRPTGSWADRPLCCGKDFAIWSRCD